MESSQHALAHLQEHPEAQRALLISAGERFEAPAAFQTFRERVIDPLAPISARSSAGRWGSKSAPLSPSLARCPPRSGPCAFAWSCMRRRAPAASLRARQQEFLETWGYPYVFDEFQFHMTLTGPVTEAARLIPTLAALFEPAGHSVTIDALTLMREPAPGATSS